MNENCIESVNEGPDEMTVDRIQRYAVEYADEIAEMMQMLAQRAEQYYQYLLAHPEDPDHFLTPVTSRTSPTVFANHREYLLNLGATDVFLDSGAIRSIDLKSFSLSYADGAMIYREADAGDYVPAGMPTMPVAMSPVGPVACDSVVLVPDPLLACILASDGQVAMAISPEGWCAWLPEASPDPTPFDAASRSRLAPEIARFVKDKHVVLSPAYGQGSQCLLGHAIKAQVPVASVKTLNSGSDFKNSMASAMPIPRYFDAYPFEEGPEGLFLHFRYPVYYAANDKFIPKLEKERVEYSKAKDGKASFSVTTQPLNGVPYARATNTLVEISSTGRMLILDACSGDNAVVEAMEGVTSDKRLVRWNQKSDEYKIEKLCERGFTGVRSEKIPEWREFLDAQKGSRPSSTIFATKKKGWFGIQRNDGTLIDPAGYILENHSVALPGVEKIQPTKTSSIPTSKAGTLAGWCDIYIRLLRNRNVAGLTGFAVSGIFLSLLNGLGEPGIINIYGGSGKGKSTIQRMIATLITGPGQGHDAGSGLHSWNQTPNALEGPLEARGDAFILFEELGLAEGKSSDMYKSVYMIANGRGKGRMKADGSMRDVKTWMVQVISTGEKAIKSVLLAENKSERGGIKFRVMDVPLEVTPSFEHISRMIDSGNLGCYQGLCDTYVPEANTVREVIDASFKALTEHHGHMWMHIAYRLLDAKVRALVERRYTDYFKEISQRSGEISGVAYRRSKHIAAAMTGLELLLDSMPIPISEIERNEIVSGAQEWLESYIWRAGLDDYKDEATEMVEKFIDKVRANPARFFRPSDQHDRSVEYWGWITRRDELFIPNSSFGQICSLIDEDASRLKAALKALPPDECWCDITQRPSTSMADVRVAKGLRSPNQFGRLIRDCAMGVE